MLAFALLAYPAPAPAANVPPDASFGFFPREPLSGEIVRLVSYACDPDGSLAEQAWDLDDDGSFDDGLGPEVSRSFPGGSHRVRLRVSDRNGAVAVGVRRIDVTPGAPAYVIPRPIATPLLSPFPIVRLRGRVVRGRTWIALLTVRAPVCSKVTVRCRGRSCPARRATKQMGRRPLRFRRFERRLRAGVRLDVLIGKPDRVGKFTRFVIRRGRPPRRFDRCLRFGEKRGTPCPGD